jgi:hypothetical protein
LLNTKARAAVTVLLEGESLQDASVWPDEIKPPYGRLSGTAEARDFNREHKDNKKWHYVNYPVGSKSYSLSGRFSYPHDIVHTINGCITVLEGGNYEGLTPKEALRWIVHLVGDIHQPLHTINGYYDISDPDHPKLETNFAKIDPDTGDGGGNALDYGPEELHACWDKVLVNDVFATNDPSLLATHVMQGVNPDTYKATGTRSRWATRWAGESMKLAASAYADIEFGKVTLNSHGDVKAIAVKLMPSVAEYRDKYKSVIQEQLRKAGVRLAQILNSIDWDTEP